MLDFSPHVFFFFAGEGEVKPCRLQSSIEKGSVAEGKFRKVGHSNDWQQEERAPRAAAAPSRLSTTAEPGRKVGSTEVTGDPQGKLCPSAGFQLSMWYPSRFWVFLRCLMSTQD